MKKSLAILLLIALFLGSALQAQDVPKPALRTWKDSTGQFSLEATFVRVDGEQVVLQGVDKKEIRLSLARLSVADQQYVKARLAAASNANNASTNTKAEPILLKLVSTRKSFKAEIISADADVVIIKRINDTSPIIVYLSNLDRDSLTRIIAELGRRLNASPKSTPDPQGKPDTILDITLNSVTRFPEKYVGKTVRVKGVINAGKTTGNYFRVDTSGQSKYIPAIQQGGLYQFAMVDGLVGGSGMFFADKKKFGEFFTKLNNDLRAELGGGFVEKFSLELEVVADVGLFTDPILQARGITRKYTGYTVRSIKILKLTSRG